MGEFKATGMSAPSDRKFIALSSTAIPGFSLRNSRKQVKEMWLVNGSNPPFTVSHSVGMVAAYS